MISFICTYVPTCIHIYIYIYIYNNDYIGVEDSGTPLLLHGGPIYMAICGRIWLYMRIYTLKYVFGAFGSELIFLCLNLYF